jgi:MFS family permease
MVGAAVGVVLVPITGALSDRVGRKPVFLAGVVAMGAAVLPTFALINTGDSTLFLLALVLVFGLAMAPAAGVTGSLFSLVFDADVRYSAVSVGYTLSQVAGSAFAPTIAVALYTATGTSNAIAAYLIAVSVISAVSAAFLPGPWRIARRETG